MISSLLSRPLEPGANLLPRTSSVGAFLQINQTPVQLGSVGFGYGKLVELGGDGIPDGLDELDPIGHAELGGFGKKRLFHEAQCTSTSAGRPFPITSLTLAWDQLDQGPQCMIDGL
jgi:hypothetical protein